MKSLYLDPSKFICSECWDNGHAIIYCAPGYLCPACDKCKLGKSLALVRQLDIICYEDLFAPECGEYFWGKLDQEEAKRQMGIEPYEQPIPVILVRESQLN